MHCEFKSDGIPEGKKYDVVSKQKQEEQKKKTTSLFYSVINNVSWLIKFTVELQFLMSSFFRKR